MKDQTEYACTICGWYTEDKPWGEDGQSPTFEICPRCGVEFGYEDYIPESADAYRKAWVEKGKPWFDKRIQTENETEEV